MILLYDMILFTPLLPLFIISWYVIKDIMIFIYYYYYYILYIIIISSSLSHYFHGIKIRLSCFIFRAATYFYYYWWVFIIILLYTLCFKPSPRYMLYAMLLLPLARLIFAARIHDESFRAKRERFLFIFIMIHYYIIFLYIWYAIRYYALLYTLFMIICDYYYYYMSHAFAVYYYYIYIIIIIYIFQRYIMMIKRYDEWRDMILFSFAAARHAPSSPRYYYYYDICHIWDVYAIIIIFFSRHAAFSRACCCVCAMPFSY